MRRTRRVPTRVSSVSSVSRRGIFVALGAACIAIALALAFQYRSLSLSDRSKIERFSTHSGPQSEGSGKAGEEGEAGFGFTLPIYIISLPIRKITRLDPLMGRIQEDARYEVVEVDAVDGRSDIVDDRETFMSPGQAGCFLSHVHFWKKIVARSEPFALVLEDDATIRLPERLPDLVGLVKRLPEGWDVLYLGGVYQPHRDGRPHTIARIDDKIVKSDTFMYYSHAYVVTREAAKELLRQSRQVSTGGPSLRAFDSVIPVDEWMTHEDRKMNVYNTDPLFVSKSDDGVSDTYDMPPMHA